jgi:hypothetical protein
MIWRPKLTGTRPAAGTTGDDTVKHARAMCGLRYIEPRPSPSILLFVPRTSFERPALEKGSRAGPQLFSPDGAQP